MKSEIVLTPVKTDSTYFIGEWIIPGSIVVRTTRNTLLTQNQWAYKEIGGFFSLTDTIGLSSIQTDTLFLSFDFIPLSLRRVYEPEAFSEFDSSLIATEGDSLSNQIFLNQSQSSINYSNLNQRGSLSRGIIVGTNQDFALESGLNFELSGELTENLRIEAALTDRSIPIQPDGTTQNLREFDRVFIQVQSPTTLLQMGDVDVSFEQSTFARLNRRLQGAAGYNQSKAGNYSGVASVVRGRFNSRLFQGQDGVQGPYRLTGNEEEEFVIILAGTERVFINGQQVKRGEEHEYIIDYGLGEVYFTNNLLIKDETRILIEYEYIDQNFNRTLVAAEGGTTFGDGRFKLNATVIRQADGNDLLSQQTLTEDDIELLKQVGDNTNNAVVSGAEVYNPDIDDETNILYALVDTTLNGQAFSIYVNKPGSPENIYRVRFSNVGDQNGSYIRSGNAVNGISYEWIGPGQGSYEPFRRLPSPIKQQMAALNGTFALSDRVQFFGEFAASDYDRNRFSSIDDDDNVDYSYIAGFAAKQVQTGLGMLSANIQRRYSGEHFEFFERTRDVEFERKWDIQSNEQTRESINEADLKLDFGEQSFVEGSYGFVDRTGFSSSRQGFVLQLKEEGKVQVEYEQDWVLSDSDFQNRNGNWFRQIGSVSNSFKVGETSLTPYMSFWQENRTERNIQSDSLLQTSFSFYDVGPGLRLAIKKLSVDYAILIRKENRVLDDDLQKESEALEHKFLFDINPSRFFQSRNQLRFRSKTFTAPFQQQGNSNRNGLLIRSNTNYELSSEQWNGEVLYEANTRRQALFQETYIEVGPELGQYVWDDLNEDGVEQIDEFFPELSPNEGVYLRQLLPSDELFPVIDLKTRFRNEFNPFGFLKGGNSFSNLVGNIKIRSRIDIQENSTTNDLSDVYLLRLGSFRNDSTTIQGRISWEKEIDLLPASEGIDLFVRYNQLRSKSRRSSEILSSFTDVFAVRTTFDITSRVQARAGVNQSTNQAKSSSLNNRNFDIRSQGIELGFDATINRSWRTGLVGNYIFKTDEEPIEETNAKIFKLRSTNRAFLFKKIQSNSFLEIRNTLVNGTSSSFGAFELTEGTGEGFNVLWNISANYRLNNLLRFSVNYDGRTIKNRPVLHSVKLVVNAIF